MNVVVDASAAAAVAMKLPRAAAFRRALRQAERVQAPDIIVAELTNVFWKMAAFEGADPARCGRALSRAVRLPDELVPTADLAPEVLALALQLRHPAYDLFYLVLARRHAAALATMDRKLLALARRLKIDAAGP